MKNLLETVRWTVGTTLLAFALGIGLLGAAGLSASEYRDDDDAARYSQGDARGHGAFAVNATYSAECGACHLAYPPSLLPTASWQAIVSGLDDHFGDNAELPDQAREEVLAYLLDNAIDRGRSRWSGKWLRGTAGETPLRITDLAHFRDEHGEVPERMVKDNPQVSSFGNCNACHASAERGVFDDDTVDIPGFGRWDD